MIAVYCDASGERILGNKDVVLIAMPWLALERTPIQLGILQPVVEKAGFTVGTRSFFFTAMEHFAANTAHLPPSERITVVDCERIVNLYGNTSLGDWLFVVPPYYENNIEADEQYVAYLRSENVSEEMIAKAFRIRSLVPSFLERCADDVLSASPRVVGFSTCFNQNVASLVLSKILKERDRSLHVVFGGANCDGPMGVALHRTFPWIDTVVRGEGENVFPELLRNIFAGGPIDPQPGLCYRKDGEALAVDQVGAKVVLMDDIPTPDYDEYFERLERSPFRAQVSPKVLVLFESARGCWWGEKNHCTFCGLNGSSMKFRSKTPSRVTEEIYSIASKYRRMDFQAVDNIIDLKYVQGLLPQLKDFRRKGYDFKLFYETKSNLKKEQVRAMREAGIRSIQPGIESFSNIILNLMKKGVTGLQNIRLLKWARQYEIIVTWNIIYGFPGEPAEEYARMVDIMQSLTHLQPPSSSSPLTVTRFSPYHQDPSAFGLKINPSPQYRFLYDTDDATLSELAYDFTHSYDDGQEPSSYVGPVKEMIELWRESYHKDANSLSYRRGPGFITINDRRSNMEASDYHLEETEAKIYLSCDAGATPAAIAKSLRESGNGDLNLAEIKEFLDALVEARLVYEEEGRYLSLAIPTQVAVDDLEFEAHESEPLPSLVHIASSARPSLTM